MGELCQIKDYIENPHLNGKACIVRAYDQFSSTDAQKYWLVEVQDSEWMGVKL